MHQAMAFYCDIEKRFRDWLPWDQQKISSVKLMNILYDLKYIETTLLELRVEGLGQTRIQLGWMLIQYVIQSLELCQHESDLFMHDIMLVVALSLTIFLPNCLQWFDHTLQFHSAPLEIGVSAVRPLEHG